MNKRWYDNDPTLSMAISLLQNASRTHQEMAARYMFNLMKSRDLLDSAELRTKEDRVRFIFPSFQRSRFEMHARHLVELMKHLPANTQQDLAIQLINYIYMLDCGITEFPDMEPWGETPTLAQPESSSG
jgi:hypothetical protein